MDERDLPRARGPHPTAEELHRARHGPRDASSEAALAHAALCAACAAEEWRLEGFDAPEPMSRRAKDDAWRRFLGVPPARRAVALPRLLALAATLVVAVSAMLFARHRPTGDAVRGDASAPALTSPSGLLDEAPRAFVFSAPGESPRVVVFDAARAFEWTSAPSATGRVDFPDDQRARLVPGVEYRWTLLGTAETPAARAFTIR